MGWGVALNDTRTHPELILLMPSTLCVRRLSSYVICTTYLTTTRVPVCFVCWTVWTCVPRCWLAACSWEENQKTKQAERKARKKEAQAAIVQEMRQNGQTKRKKEDVGVGEGEGEDVAKTTTKKKKRQKGQKDKAASGSEAEPQADSNSVGVGSLPPKKRKSRDAWMEESQPATGGGGGGDDEGDEDSTTADEPKPKKKKKKKAKTPEVEPEAAPEKKSKKKKKSKKEKKEKKEKKSKERPVSPTDDAKNKSEHRGSDGILKEPRSSSGQYKRVSFSPKPETRPIPAVPFTKNKWLW